MSNSLPPLEWNQTECNGTRSYAGLENGSYEFRVRVSSGCCVAHAC